MKRKTTRTLFSLLLLILILFSCFFGTPEIPYGIKEVIANTPTPDPLKFDLTNVFSRYENGEIPFVDMSKVTSFNWDRLHIIGAFASLHRLNFRFGLSWMQCSTNITWSDGYVLLIFTQEGKIVRCFDYPVNPYDFSFLVARYPDGIPVQEAHFISQGRDGIVDIVTEK